MKQLKIFIALLVITTLLVACGTSAKLEKTQKWMDKYISVAYGKIKTAKTAADIIDMSFNDVEDKLEKLEQEKYPYDENKTFGDVRDGDYVTKGKTSIVYVYVPIGDEDKKIAEKLAKEKGDKYYVIGTITIEFKNDIDLYNADTDIAKQVKVTNVKKDIYISAKLPDED